MLEHSKTAVFVALTALVGCSPRPAPVDKSPEPDRALKADLNPLTIADRVKALDDESQAAEMRLSNDYQRLSDAPDSHPTAKQELEGALKDFQAGEIKRCELALALAKHSPKSPASLEALEWIVGRALALEGSVGIESIDLIATHHVTSNNIRLAKIARSLSYLDSRSPAFPAAEKLLVEISKNPSPSNRAHAHLAIAMHHQRVFREAEARGDQPTDLLAEKAVTAYTVLEGPAYSNISVINGEGKNFGALAKKELHTLRNLGIGKIAPNITGETLDGRMLNLNDFRGKVTVIVFWASWCGPCMRQVPEELKLVAEFKDKEFALVGVNGDTLRADGLDAAKKSGMTWPSFWNGKGGSSGPITDLYDVTAWPKVVVLDREGKARAFDVSGEQLRLIVRQLLEK